MRSMLRCAALAALSAALAGPVEAAEYVWIEAERPSAVPTIKPPEGDASDKGYVFAAWGDESIISGGKMLSISLRANEAADRLGAAGAVFAYDFRLPSAGKWEVWARIGFEHVRSDFDWRVDGGDWRTLKSTEQTQDVQPIQVWNELAWVMLSRGELAAGGHKLEIRHRPQTKTRMEWQTVNGRRRQVAKETPDRTLHISDCFCIHKGSFRPNGKHKPDADYQSDSDKAAAAKVYELKAAAGPAERVEVELTGPWQIARWQEQTVEEAERLAPAAALPELDELYWYGIRLPGDRDAQRPEMGFWHRYVYRTRVKVPASLAGRSFYLDFQNFNMVATAFVNGRRCGWSKACSTEWRCDVTAGIRPGQVNDVAIVFKDCYYAIKDTEKGTRYYWNLPHAWLQNQGVGHRFDMPIGWDTRTGILEPVSLVAAGKVYTDDVFAMPSVRKKQLALEVTVKNPSGQAAEVRVASEVVSATAGKGAKAELVLPAASATVAAGAEHTFRVKADWADPHLWWPDDPHLYRVVTKLSIGDKVVDVRQTRFGFREWTWDSHLFRLNGVKWQMWADCDYGADPKAWVAKARKSGMNMIRYWRRDGWGGMTRRQVLDYMDEQGVPVRDSGIFDGEGALYGLTEGDRDNTRAKKALFDNWIEQLAAWVRAERNHPSVFIWSVENEIAYINSWNLGRARWAEPEIRRGAEAVMKLDPTRAAMVDGGRCLLDGSLPVNGAHYNDTSSVAQRDYPDAAYTREHWYRTKHRGAWEMIRNRPIFHGECFFANGYTPAEFAGLGGDRCFIGMSETHAARGLYAKMLSEGWRWCEVAAWHMWFGSAERSYYNAWQPVCVFCRQWNWTFAGGSRVGRTLKVFNSTRHATPIEMAWQLNVDGKRAAGERKTFRIPPGEAELTEAAVPVPRVGKRTEGEFVLTCSRDGKEVFREVKQVSIIDPDAAPKPRIAAGELVVLDPAGAVKARLAKRGIAFTEVGSVNEIKQGTKLLVVGPDAVPASKATDSLWYALAAGGTKLLVLDQEHPLHYQAVPADFDVTDYTGRIAFSEDLTHPVFAGLAQKDLFTWSGDHVVYRNAYRKASRGARSLAQCDRELNYTALSECQVRDGLMLLCQMVVGRKLGSDPVAQRLFDNMLNYVASYEPVRKNTVLVVGAATPKGKLLRSMGLKYTESAEPVAAIGGGSGIAVIDATPANLKALAAAADKVKAFTSGGGWIMLWGVTPEGLADYNRLVGYEHVIRPFQMERVVLAAPRDPLTSGLTLRDVVMESSERIAQWMAVRWASDDAFTYILDYDEIGPFAKLPTAAEMGKPADVAYPKRDHWPPNMFNGFTADDSWRYCFSIILDRGDKTKWAIELPHPEEITNFSIVLNVIYHCVTKINLYFDDDPKPFTVETRPTHDRQDFAVQGKRAKRITIELAEWAKTGRSNVIGIDNMWITVKRPEAFLRSVKPLLNIGGLMRYSMGKGGILLNQLNIVANEKLPVNAQKKANITKVLLKNLGAVFAGGKTVVVGTGLEFAPIPFEDGKPNAYLTQKTKTPWFSGRYDLSHLPVGENKLAGVTFSVADFRTSPVPACFMLKGTGSRAKEAEIKGIKVGRKCDALFFLHAYNANGRLQRWQPPRRGDRTPPTLFQYVVHYADGATEAVPVIWQRGVGHWLSASPVSLMDAPVAWAAAAPGDSSGEKAVVYAMQWNNARPGVEVRSVDFALGPDQDRWGAPALLAITAAKVME